MKKDRLEKIKSTITKLFALSKSNNENEALAALCKARELIALYNLSEAEFTEDKEEEAVVTAIVHKSFSIRKGYWIYYLAEVIAKNFKCRLVCNNITVKTYEPVFVGLSDDVDICIRVFDYAYETILKFFKTNHSIRTASSMKIRTVLEYSYGKGFTEGLRHAFEEQSSRSEVFALALSVPKVVEAFVEQEYTTRTVHRKAKSINSHLYGRGIEDGSKFTSHAQLECVV